MMRGLFTATTKKENFMEKENSFYRSGVSLTLNKVWPCRAIVGLTPDLYVERRGFTLIELLVVVLIIGILASVALPQYQKAVDKSRFSNLMAITNALAQANEVYYLANGEYATDFEELSVDIPATSISGNTATFDWGNCRLSSQQEVICFDTTRLNNAYTVYYIHSSRSGWEDHAYCASITNEAGSRFDKVCNNWPFKETTTCNAGDGSKPCRVYIVR